MDQADVQTLANDSGCIASCASEKQLLAMMVFLLWADAHPDTPLTQADVQTLQSDIGCVVSCMSEKQLMASIVQLLSELNA